MKRLLKLFGLSVEQTRESPAKDMQALKAEIDKQGEWLKKLHSHNSSMYSYVSSLHAGSAKHKKEIMGHIEGISEWIGYISRKNQEIQQDLDKLKKGMQKSLKDDFEAYHRTIIEYLHYKIKEERTITASLKEVIKSELRQELGAVFEKKMELPGISNAKIEQPITNVMHNAGNTDLSNPEKELLTLFFNENKPLTYDSISKKLNKSLNTVRVYMNSLKSKKDIIDEFTTANGSKVFSLKNSELVKTLFNLR